MDRRNAIAAILLAGAQEASTSASQYPSPSSVVKCGLEHLPPPFGVTVSPYDPAAYAVFREIAKSWPGLLQVDLSTEAKDHRLFLGVTEMAQQHLLRGGELMFCHHPGNPWTSPELGYSAGHSKNNLGSGSAWDKSGSREAIASLLPGGAHSDKLNRYLAHIADVLIQYDRSVIWRPFHEANGGWFWWGGREVAEDFKELWRHCVTSVRRMTPLVKVCLSFAVPSGSPDNPFLPWYPGNDYVDMLGLDGYTRDGSCWNPQWQRAWEHLGALDSSGKKILMLSEFGGVDGSAHTDEKFWSRALGDLKKFPRLSSAVTWTSKWAPSNSDAAKEAFRASLSQDSWCVLRE